MCWVPHSRWHNTKHKPRPSAIIGRRFSDSSKGVDPGLLLSSTGRTGAHGERVFGYSWCCRTATKTLSDAGDAVLYYRQTANTPGPELYGSFVSFALERCQCDIQSSSVLDRRVLTASEYLVSYFWYGVCSRCTTVSTSW